MLRRNEIWLGIILGLVIPFVGYALLLTIYENFDIMGWASSEHMSEDSEPVPSAYWPSA